MKVEKVSPRSSPLPIANHRLACTPATKVTSVPNSLGITAFYLCPLPCSWNRNPQRLLYLATHFVALYCSLDCLGLRSSYVDSLVSACKVGNSLDQSFTSSELHSLTIKSEWIIRRQRVFSYRAVSSPSLCLSSSLPPAYIFRIKLKSCLKLHMRHHVVLSSVMN